MRTPACMDASLVLKGEEGILGLGRELPQGQVWSLLLHAGREWSGSWGFTVQGMATGDGLEICVHMLTLDAGKHQMRDSRSWVNPNRINPKKSTPRHIIITLLKTKHKVLRAVRERWHLTFRERLWMTDFSSETLEARKNAQWASSTESKELPILNPTASENKYPSVMKRENPSQKRNYDLSTWSKRMAKWREMIKEETLEHQEGRKNMICKNISWYNMLSFSFLNYVEQLKQTWQSDVVLNVCEEFI